jgi:hypothetical protein
MRLEPSARDKCCKANALDAFVALIQLKGFYIALPLRARDVFGCFEQARTATQDLVVTCHALKYLVVQLCGMGMKLLAQDQGTLPLDGVVHPEQGKHRDQQWNQGGQIAIGDEQRVI